MQVNRQILKPSFACQMVVVLLISGNHQAFALQNPRSAIPPEEKIYPSVGPRKLPRDPQGFAELPGASGTSEVLPRAAVPRMGTAGFFNETLVNPLQPSL